MKKSLFFVAAAALALTACTSEEDVLQAGQQKAAENQGVGFEVYVPGSTNQTRSGRVNVMNTGILKQTGFGVLAYQHDNGTAPTPGAYKADDKVPDFMWNQQVFFNGTAQSWYYAPLKYWPNETNNDSQDSQAGMPNNSASGKNYSDRVSFFAYAPWVASNDNGSTTVPTYPDVEATSGIGIVQLTGNDGICDSYSAGKQDPIVRYKIAEDPNKSVDLLWGVAPAGGINYQGVDGKNVDIKEGMPLIDLWKPATNTNLKFMFQHALARIGVKVVLASDQIAPGGHFDYGNTKVTVEEIRIKGNFGKDGFLNLKNEKANEANWTVSDDKKANDDAKALVLNASNGLAEHLRYNWSPYTKAFYDYNANNDQVNVTGVTTKLADAIKVSTISDEKYKKDGTSDYSYKLTSPEKSAYSPTTPYFASVYAHAANTLVYQPFATDCKGATTYIFHKSNTGAYTDISNKFNVTYPTATVIEDLWYLENGASNLHLVGSGELETYKTKNAYRKTGKVYTPTGQVPQVGDYVFLSDLKEYTTAQLGTVSTNLYRAIPNYFMVIPTQKDNENITVKIKYWVSTTDANLEKRIVYTKNEVEKTITLPHMKNGYSYNLKLILGLNSVKLEADVEDWKTMEAEINLPQNTTE